MDYPERCKQWAEAYHLATGLSPSPSKVRRYATPPLPEGESYRVKAWEAVRDPTPRRELPAEVWCWMGRRVECPIARSILRRAMATSNRSWRLSRSGVLRGPVVAVSVAPGTGPVLAIVREFEVWPSAPVVYPYPHHAALRGWVSVHGVRIVWRTPWIVQATRETASAPSSAGTRIRTAICQILASGEAWMVLPRGHTIRHGHVLYKGTLWGPPVLGSSDTRAARICLGTAQSSVSHYASREGWQRAAEVVWTILGQHTPERSGWSWAQSARTETARKRTQRAASIAAQKGPFGSREETI